MDELTWDEFNRIRSHKYYEIKELISFIGGFDKWPLLNEDCRREVVKHMDYGSLCELKSCSKADYELVKKMPIKVLRMEISEAKILFEDHKHIKKTDTVKVRTAFHDSSYIERWFTQKGTDTHFSIRARFSAKERRFHFVRQSTNYYNAAMEYVDICLKKCNYVLDGMLQVQMTNNPFSNCKLERLVRVSNVEMGIDNVELFNWWIQRLPEKMWSFEMYKFDHAGFRRPIRSEFLGLPQIKQVEHLDFSCAVALTNEQFLNLRNRTISSMNVSVTNEGVNQFLKRWVKGKGNQEFEYVDFFDFSDQNRNVILQGLQAREWDDEFKKEK